ncbi:3-oxoacyl-reductase [Hypoxylon sp. FL1857]|nr:3-oxoacyl-reductase [Hypoxylon sp. FL1857]
MDITGYALITGGGSGIGKASCRALAKTGARGIFVADLNLESAKQTASESQAVAINPAFRAVAVHLDITVEESVKSTIARMVETFGRIDYCVHSAGIRNVMFAEVANTNLADVQHLLEVNVQGTFLIISHVLAAMRLQEARQLHPTSPERGLTRGTFVNMASLASYLPMPGMVQYVTSKHAVMGITRTAAFENLSHNIRVNSILPSFVDTPMVRRGTELLPGVKMMLSKTPMGRLATVEEITDVVLFLCSPMSSFCTGCEIIVDGGMSMGFNT